LRLVKSYYGEDKWRATAAVAAVKGWRFSLMMVWQGGVSAVVDSRTGLFIRAHGVVFSTSAIISAIRIAHTSTQMHIHVRGLAGAHGKDGE
jgi:hypothetical protein